MCCKGGNGDMKFRCIITWIVISVCLSGCGRNVEPNNIHNEIVGMFASANDKVYYIDNNILYQYNGNDTVKLSENSIEVQKWNNTVYFIYTDNHKDYSLYEVTEEGTEKLFDLNSGTYQQSIVYDNKLYSCINNEIAVYGLQSGSYTALATKKPVTRFCVNDNIVYYWRIDFTDSSLDDYANAIGSGNELNIFEGELYSFDINLNKSEKILNTTAKNDRFFLSPIKDGIIFFNPDKRELDSYSAGEIKTLFHGDVLNILTDDDNIYYSADDDIIHKININTGDITVFTDDTNTIYGFDSQWIYGGNGRILKRD